MKRRTDPPSLMGSGQTEVITVVRDRFGIPHIEAETSRGVCFALGWCQAEDRLEQIYLNYAKATGITASICGDEWIEHDFHQRLHRHRDAAQAYTQGKIPQELLEELLSFQDGVRAYCEKHPAKVPDFAFPIRSADAVALARYLMFQWPIGQAYGDLGSPPPGRTHLSSNQWALAPSRTADGRAILCIDPHVPWEGEFRFYEAQVTAGPDRRHGFFPVGTCYMALGHTSGVAWACTTGGPDTADVYRVRRHSENENLYAYDDAWRSMETETVKIEVAATSSGMPGKKRIVERKVYRTHHGPIVVMNERVGYAIRTAYDDRAEVIEQMRAMNYATTLGEFRDTMEMGQLMPQNIMAADRDGHIWYCRTGRVPIRPTGYDWNRPVPGDTHDTEWLGIHNQEDLVQVLDPPAGYMQNCNVSADQIMISDAPSPVDYPAYIFNGSNKTNPRGERALQLLSAAHDVDTQAALEIVNDTFVVGSPFWQDVLRRASARVPGEVRERHLTDPIRVVLDWDGRAESDSIGATLFRNWMECERDQRHRYGEDRDLRESMDEETATLLLRGLAEACERLDRRHGTWKVSWGDEHRVERGSHSFPVAGGQWLGPLGSFATLRTINNRTAPDERGHRIAHYGQSHVMLAHLGESGIESYTVTPYGISDDAESPFFADQAGELLAQKKLKATRFDAGVPETEITSRVLLEYSEDRERTKERE